MQDHSSRWAALPSARSLPAWATLLAFIASIRVLGNPTVTVTPEETTVNAGAAATFVANANGTAPLQYQWYREGEIAVSGATNASFARASVAWTDQARYFVRVSDSSGSTDSALVRLNVNSPPIVDPLANMESFLGTSVAFVVTPRGTPPFTYQWLFNDQNVTDATNSALNLTNLTFAQAGSYAVTVGNDFGSTTTSNVTLNVLALPIPFLSFGTYQPPTPPAAGSIPVYYSARGSETNLSFSLGYDPAVFTNVYFQPSMIQTICSCSIMNNEVWVIAPIIVTNGPTATARSGAHLASLAENSLVFLDQSQLTNGRLGVRIELPAGHTFDVGYSNFIGYATFELVAGATNAYSGALAFKSHPTPLQFAPAADGSSNVLASVVLPLAHWESPVLNPQSGLLEQRFEITNPGELLGNVRLRVAGLGVDSRTNSVRWQNAIGSTVVGTNVWPVADLGSVAAGETRPYTLEYYASDRRPASVTPTFQLAIVPAATIDPSGTQLAIHNWRFTNGVFLVEFPTQTGFRYYVQWAAPASGTNAPQFKTALPAVFGTGSYVQWLDNGPPKTGPLPTNGVRLYRLIETR